MPLFSFVRAAPEVQKILGPSLAREVPGEDGIKVGEHTLLVAAAAEAPALTRFSQPLTQHAMHLSASLLAR